MTKVNCGVERVMYCKLQNIDERNQTKQIPSCLTKWMNLQDIKVSEVRQSLKDCMIPHI